MAGASEAWAATGSWRGDLKLFARIAAKAVNEIEAAKQPGECRIEFAVRHDLDAYGSVEELLERVPYSTTRNFLAARIVVGAAPLLVEVEFGRKRDEEAAFNCRYGVAVRVTSDGTVDAATVGRVRTEVTKVVARGGFEFLKGPTEGPTEERGDLAEALLRRWQERRRYTQLVFGGITLAVGMVAQIFGLVFGDDGEIGSGASFALFTVIIVAAVQAISYPLSMAIFPAIELADVTPGRRMLKVVGRSGLISAAVGIGATVLKAKLGY